MAIYGQQSKNVIFSDDKSATLKKKTRQIKYNPHLHILFPSNPELSSAILHTDSYLADPQRGVSTHAYVANNIQKLFLSLQH